MGDAPPLFGLSDRGAALQGRRTRPGRASRGVGQDLFWTTIAGALAGFVLLVFRPSADRIREAEAECGLLRAEIASLESCVSSLRRWEMLLAMGDPDAWAAIARERLGWTRPGERMIIPSAGPGVRSRLSAGLVGAKKGF